MTKHNDSTSSGSSGHGVPSPIDLKIPESDTVLSLAEDGLIIEELTSGEGDDDDDDGGLVCSLCPIFARHGGKPSIFVLLPWVFC
jgi:hypothetical protein